MKHITKNNDLQVTTLFGIQQISLNVSEVPKGSYTNPEYIKKSLTIYYTKKYWKKNLKL